MLGCVHANVLIGRHLRHCGSVERDSFHEMVRACQHAIGDSEYCAMIRHEMKTKLKSPSKLLTYSDVQKDNWKCSQMVVVGKQGWQGLRAH